MFTENLPQQLLLSQTTRHPTEHKMAAVKYLTNRMNTYYLNTTSKERWRKIIKHILQENKYDTSIMDITLPKPKTSKQKQDQNGQNLYMLERKPSLLRSFSKTPQ